MYFLSVVFTMCYDVYNLDFHSILGKFLLLQHFDHTLVIFRQHYQECDRNVANIKSCQLYRGTPRSNICIQRALMVTRLLRILGQASIWLNWMVERPGNETIGNGFIPLQLHPSITICEISFCLPVT